MYTGKTFTIRKWQKGDESYLAFHANNFNIWKTVRDAFPHPYTYDDALVWVDKNQAIENPVTFAICIDNDPIGCIGLVPGTDIHKKNMELGYWLGEEYWGQGITTEAVLWLVEYAFSNFNITRLWASVFSSNQASVRVLVKAGFLHEATLKQAVFKNGVYHDELIYSIVKLT